MPYQRKGRSAAQKLALATAKAKSATKDALSELQIPQLGPETSTRENVVDKLHVTQPILHTASEELQVANQELQDTKAHLKSVQELLDVTEKLKAMAIEQRNTAIEEKNAALDKEATAMEEMKVFQTKVEQHYKALHVEQRKVQ